jgi:hypothetical protein
MVSLSGGAAMSFRAHEIDDRASSGFDDIARCEDSR